MKIEIKTCGGAGRYSIRATGRFGDVDQRSRFADNVAWQDVIAQVALLLGADHGVTARELLPMDEPPSPKLNELLHQ